MIFPLITYWVELNGMVQASQNMPHQCLLKCLKTTFHYSQSKQLWGFNIMDKCRVIHCTLMLKWNILHFDLLKIKSPNAILQVQLQPYLVWGLKWTFLNSALWRPQLNYSWSVTCGITDRLCSNLATFVLFIYFYL